jgi:exo-1,4-beta-D-glucosaminidase
MVRVLLILAVIGLCGACDKPFSAPPSSDGDAAADRDGGTGDGDGEGGDAAVPAPDPCPPDRTVLSDGWRIQASAQVADEGAAISTPGYDASGWHPARVPSTVLAALVADGTYPDPTVRDQLADIPREPLEGPWWYRTELALPAYGPDEHVTLALSGISFRADVWLNGQLVADRARIAGTYVAHALDVTRLVRPGQPNVLAIEVWPGHPKQVLSITFHDWNPDPPGNHMGLWREVALVRTGPVALSGAHVQTALSDSLDRAELTVRVDAENKSDKPLSTVVRASVFGHELERTVELAAGEKKRVEFDPRRHPELAIEKPAVWWPARMGAQPLHALCVAAGERGAPSDQQGLRFGIREVKSELDMQGHRFFRVNGERFLLRGGGWASDMLLRPMTPARRDAELGYTLDLGLNAIRLEGKLETDDFYDRADELGILTMPGWMCCDRWESWGQWGDEDRAIARASMASEARRLRNHPSVLTFMIASDHAPPDDVAAAYVAALKENGWSADIMPSANHESAPGLPSGVKMMGPYDWVAPSYWYLDTGRGGAHGFNTESGPGPAIPERESLEAMMNPAQLEALWQNPGGDHFHAGTSGTAFDNLAVFAEALSARHGAAESLDDFIMKAQLMNYEAERAAFEAYARQKHVTATGFVHWLLNNAWPSLIWHLYGHDLAPAAGYFAAKKANEPLHIQYSYDDGSVVVVNDLREPVAGLTAQVRAYDLDATMRFEHEGMVDVAEDGVAHVVTLPELSDASATYFVALTLSRGQEALSQNFYWLSQKAEIIDWSDFDFRRTGTAEFADFRALAELPQVELDAAVESEDAGKERITRVTLENGSGNLAFFVRITLKGENGELITPLIWDDNYVSLEPGERRTLSVRHARPSGRVELSLRGFNVAERTLN